jgi:hypothetical protein
LTGAAQSTGGISFSVSHSDAPIIRAIADRAVWLARKNGVRYRRMDACMDITACHANDVPLRLAELLAADDFNFAHDIFGILQHLDRRTGKLGGCFLPRFARPQRAEGATP